MLSKIVAAGAIVAFWVLAYLIGCSVLRTLDDPFFPIGLLSTLLGVLLWGAAAFAMAITVGIWHMVREVVKG